jgi:hypothetical protein
LPSELDLGDGVRAVLHEQPSTRCVVLLPGRRYPTRAPALWFARETALATGWSALEVIDEIADGDDPAAWSHVRLTRAIEAAPGDDVAVVGKSMTSLAAGAVAARGLPAVWMTPLMGEPAVLEGLSMSVRPVLLVAGTADPAWDGAAVPPTPGLDVCEVQDADHALQRPGDVAGSLDALQIVTAAVARFLSRV